MITHLKHCNLEKRTKQTNFTKKIMTAKDIIKTRLIDRIIATKNEKLLVAISNIFESTQSNNIVSLSSEQIEMLLMSEKDIEIGDLVSESELNKSDTELLN